MDVERWSGRALLAPGLVGYLGLAGHAARHAHHTVQVVAGLDGPVTVTTAEAAVTAAVVAVPSGLPHEFDAFGQRVALVLADPCTVRGLTGVCTGAGSPVGSVQALPEWSRRTLRAVGADLVVPDQAVGDARTSPTAGRTSPGPTTVARLPTHPAVTAALRYVDATLPGPVRLADAAAAGHVSPTRLTHLFAARTGLPLRRYVLWRRLALVVVSLRDDMTLADAAADAGFADHAHLDRVFAGTFGLVPSAVLRSTTVLTHGLGAPAA